MEYKVLSEPKKIYREMISDIRNAKREIFLETYIYDDDKVGRMFRDELTKKVREGVRVKLLIDAWGSSVKKNFFKEFVEAGGEVRFFRELKYTLRFFDANHERNHRKLLLVDSKISYIGSINITAECLEWGELVLRVVGTLAISFRKSFILAWHRFDVWKFRRMHSIIHKGFKILQDFPRSCSAEKRYRRMILNAKKEILILTPYFTPSIRIRHAFKSAIKKGVEIKIILPASSDIPMADVLRRRYFGSLYNTGVKIYYSPRFIHSKLLVVDKKFFLVGSSNLNYRSFVHQFEINLFGYNRKVVSLLRKYFFKILRMSERFNYDLWVKRHFLVRLKDWIVEKSVAPCRKYL